MQLWTDYEGVTIDGAYPLQKLLMPEGRSAFYSTAGPDGEPTVVRLIECHFDEEEILARWRCVEALNHPNFLGFKHFGQTEIDGRPVVYAVLAKVDGNLAEVLDHGPLTVKDVIQLATSLVAALEVLHTHGFIHEHVEPRNIFAIGDVVKLRSDCIREAPEGDEGRAAKQRDVRNLATVLLQALTQRESLEGLPASSIPAPFGPIIRNGLDGTWGLEKIRAALETDLALKRPATPNWASASPATPAAPAPAAPATQLPVAATRPSAPVNAQRPLPLLKDNRTGFTRTSRREDPWMENQSSSRRTRWIRAAAVFALLLLVLTLVLARSRSGRHQSGPLSTPPSQLAPQPSLQPAPPPAPSPAAANLPPAGSHAGWRVIAFTYNRKADAEKKAAGIARTHPQLNPSVFAPSGHAPFFVSIGGVMDRDSAYALARRARSLGLPRDSFARNFSR